MKLSQDPTARARLRLLRPWLTPSQFNALQSAFEEVEVRPGPGMLSRFTAAWQAARIAWLAATPLRWTPGSEP